MELKGAARRGLRLGSDSADEIRARPASRRGGGPLLVEVLGPAGSGKTSVARALRSGNDPIRIGLGLGRSAYLRSLLLKVVPFVAVWIRDRRRGRWFDQRDMRSIAFLDAWHRAVEQRRSRDELVVLFDHGPLYRLARLREFGPAITRSERFQRWWDAEWEVWVDALDVVVWLDAADDVLIRRVGQRGHWYLSRDLSDEERHRFLHRYRKAFAEIIPGGSQDGPMILRYRSDDRSIDEIAGDVRRALGSLAPQTLAHQGLHR